MATRTKTAGLLPTFISAASGTLRDHSCSFVSIRVITRRSFRTLSKPRWSSAFRLRKWDCRKPVHRPRLKPELQHRCGRFMAQGCCYDKTRCPPRPRHPFQHESQTNGTRMTTNQISEHSPLAFIRDHSFSFASKRERCASTLSTRRWSSAFRLRKSCCRKPVHRPRLKPELQHRCGSSFAQGCCYDKTRCPPRPRHPFQHESQTNGTRMTTNQITEHSPLAFIRGHSCSFVSIRVQNESAAPQHSRRGAGVQPSGCGSHAAESQFIDPG